MRKSKEKGYCKNCKSIEEYLDKVIRFWRIQHIESKNKEERLMAMHYIDAFQSVRISIYDRIHGRH